MTTMFSHNALIQWLSRFIVLIVATTVVIASGVAAEHVPVRYWWAFEYNGDKPGCGFVVIERAGKIENAHVFIFLPDSPETQSGHFFQMSDIKQDGKVLHGGVKGLTEPEGRVSHFRIEFRDEFDSGKRIRAEVTDPDRDRSKQRPQEMTFVLQGDQWDKLK
jgi:hypothetical protein